MITNIKAQVFFESIGQRVNLFQSGDYIALNGNWSERAVILYCKSIARRRGFSNQKLEIEIINEDFDIDSEKLLTVNI